MTVNNVGFDFRLGKSEYLERSFEPLQRLLRERLCGVLPEFKEPYFSVVARDTEILHLG